jgi:hypothetical protein
MQQGQATLRNMGSKDVFTSINFTGMGWIGGTIGDYRFTIVCITAKDVVVFNVAGPDGATVENHRKSVVDGMQRSR